jgi:molybdopterin-containing oxidoreductase family iron-sulfur binding subunit
MSEIDRRDFLKLIGVGAGTAATTTGCYRAAELPEKLVPYVVQPEEITPGVAVSYASTCQGCSAACGLYVTTREGRPIKLEGNPEHPVNQGKLCGRGQASIGLTYHPDRYRQPMKRGDAGLEPTTWEDATKTFAGALDQAGGKIAVLGGPVGPTLSSLIDQWLQAVGGGRRVSYEPFSYEALSAASDAVFGVASRPIFDLSDTDYVIDFGADSLGTWLSPVEHSRQVAAARDAVSEEGRHHRFVYVGPRLDETASSSDEWLPAKPGSEGILALGLARVAFDSAVTRGRPVGGNEGLIRGVLASFDANSVAELCGVSADDIRRIGRELLEAKRPAALPPGVALTSRRATATAGAVLLLNAIVGAVGKTVQVPPAGSGPRVDTYRDVIKLIDAMKSNAVSVLVIHDSNPLYSLPPSAGFAEALDKVGLVVSTATLPDETSERAHLVLPDHSSLESWGDAEPRPGVRSLVQPTLRPIFDTQSLGDTLLGAARAGRSGGRGLPEGSFRGVVESAWQGSDWAGTLARGGDFAPKVFTNAPAVASSVRRLEFKEPQLEGDGAFVLLPTPSPLLGDGSGANLPWLQETPDPITKIAWQSWAEISKNAAEKLDVKPGDVLEIKNQFGTLQVPVWPRGGVRDDVVVVAIGQGHTVGRYASLENDGMAGEARGVNVISALPSLTDEEGGRAWLAAKADVSATGDYQRLPFTQGTDNKRKRMLGESISLATLASGVNPYAANEEEMHGGGHGADQGDDGHGGDHGEAAVAGGAAAAAHGAGHGEDLPHEIRRGYDMVDDAYDSPFKWGMAVDVDKCTGCSACVVACAIENNISQVGESGVLRSRQMSWLRIERYVTNGEATLEAGRPGPKNNEELGNTDVRNSPMMCQQCGAAPCEPVCPVLATYHTEQGLNGMVYNRCIGTRYCSNNCPYKVRRFNWFDYQIEGWPEPMPLMLNPDVTVRGQGVMEKCTFCIQRINRGRLNAKQEGRDVGDTIQTACQQTCPADAIVFGNVKDKDTRAVKRVEANQGRAYHALHVLNTRPSVTYLAKVKRTESHGGHATVPMGSPDTRRAQMNAERGSETGSGEVEA